MDTSGNLAPAPDLSWESAEKLAWTIARRSFYSNSILDLEDFVQEGLAGLVKEGLENKSVALVSTILYRRMVDCLRKHTILPRSPDRSTPSYADSSIDATYEGSDNTRFDDDSSLSVEFEDTLGYVLDCRAELEKVTSERDRFVLKQLSLGFNTLEVGQQLGVSQSRVSQLLTRAYKDLGLNKTTRRYVYTPESREKKKDGLD